MPEEDRWREYIRKEITVLGAIFHEDRMDTSKCNWIKREEKVGTKNH